jgi:hypothetical protein
MKIRHIIIIVLFALINIAVIFSLRKGKDAPLAEKEATVFIQKVKGTTVHNTEEQFSVMGFGTISSFNAVDISCEVQGKLSKGRKELKPGVTFNKGELIFTINDTETQYALRARKSGFINIVASLLPDIKVDFPTEYTKWENYVGQIKLNEDLPQLPAWTTTKEKIFLSTRNVLSEYFSIMGAEEQLKKYKIFAPFTGIITEAFVSHQAIVNPGTKALRFVEIGNYEIPVSIPAEQIGKILLGTEADIFTTTGTL